MKVTLYKATQHHAINSWNNASLPVQNSFTKINTQTRDTVSFGHYLDDEKEEQENALSNTKSAIDSTQVDISRENDSHGNKIAGLNRKIRELNTEVDATANEITSLRGKVSKKNTKIEQVRSEGQSLEVDIKSGKKPLEQLQTQQKKIIRGISDDAEIATTTRESMISQQIEQAQIMYTQEMKNAVTGIKNKLIQHIINPTIQESEGDNVKVPSSLLIETDSDVAAKKVFEWITRKTGSNYAIIDAQECGNISGLMSLLSHVSQRAKKDFDSSKVRTFTLLENFDSFIPSQNEANNFATTSFKEFVSKCSELYNNTIAAISKPGNKSNEIKGLNFDIKLKLDSIFIQDKRLGYEAILTELKNLKTLGQNQLFSAFEALR